MDLIGGGATDYLSFLRYMGTERALGSPFQIDFPSPSSPPPSNSSIPPPIPLEISAHSCASPDPNIRCACPDCPDTCAELPPIKSPREKEESRCRVGKMDCFPFVLIILYAVVLGASIVLLVSREARSRWGNGGIRLPDIQLDEEEDESRFSRSQEVGSGPWNRLRNRLSIIGDAWNSSKVRQKIANSELVGGGGGDLAIPSSPDIGGDPLAEDQEYDETPVPLSSSAAMRAGRSRNRSSTGGGGGGGSNGFDTGDSGGGSPSSGTSSRSRKNGGSGHRANGSTPSTLNSSSNHRQSLSFEPSFSSSTPTIPAQPRTYPLNTLLSKSFHTLGYFCAKRPVITILLGLTVCGLINIGWKRFEVEKDPVRLWVPSGSPVANQKQVFEANFGPFYRTEQVFFSVAPPSSRSAIDEDNEDAYKAQAWNPIDSPVLTFESLSYILSVENTIRTLTSPSSKTSLPQVCFAPSSTSPESTNLEDCIVQSPLAYFQHSLEDSGITERNWRERLDSCAESPASCLPTFGQPIEPRFVFGKIPTEGEGKGKASEARAVVVTYVVRNSLDKGEIARAEEWEGAVERYLKEISKRGGEANQRGLRIDWSTGRSLEEELNAATNTDVGIVVLSYLLMFVYVAIGLGGSGMSVLRLLGRGIKKGAKKGMAMVRGGGQIKLGDDSGAMGSRIIGVEDDEGIVPETSIGAALRKKVLVESKVGLGESRFPLHCQTADSLENRFPQVSSAFSSSSFRFRPLSLSSPSSESESLSSSPKSYLSSFSLSESTTFSSSPTNSIRKTLVHYEPKGVVLF